MGDFEFHQIDERHVGIRAENGMGREGVRELAARGTGGAMAEGRLISSTSNQKP